METPFMNDFFDNSIQFINNLLGEAKVSSHKNDYASQAGRDSDDDTPNFDHLYDPSDADLYSDIEDEVRAASSSLTPEDEFKTALSDMIDNIREVAVSDESHPVRKAMKFFSTISIDAPGVAGGIKQTKEIEDIEKELNGLIVDARDIRNDFNDETISGKKALEKLGAVVSSVDDALARFKKLKKTIVNLYKTTTSSSEYRSVESSERRKKEEAIRDRNESVVRVILQKDNEKGKSELAASYDGTLVGNNIVKVDYSSTTGTAVKKRYYFFKYDPQGEDSTLEYKTTGSDGHKESPNDDEKLLSVVTIARAGRTIWPKSEVKEIETETSNSGEDKSIKDRVQKEFSKKRFFCQKLGSSNAEQDLYDSLDAYIKYIDEKSGEMGVLINGAVNINGKTHSYIGDKFGIPQLLIDKFFNDDSVKTSIVNVGLDPASFLGYVHTLSLNEIDIKGVVAKVRDSSGKHFTLSEIKDLSDFATQLQKRYDKEVVDEYLPKDKKNDPLKNPIVYLFKLDGTPVDESATPFQISKKLWHKESKDLKKLDDAVTSNTNSDTQHLNEDDKKAIIKSFESKIGSVEFGGWSIKKKSGGSGFVLVDKSEIEKTKEFKTFEENKTKYLAKIGARLSNKIKINSFKTFDKKGISVKFELIPDGSPSINFEISNGKKTIYAKTSFAFTKSSNGIDVEKTVDHILSAIKKYSEDEISKIVNGTVESLKPNEERISGNVVFWNGETTFDDDEYDHYKTAHRLNENENLIAIINYFL